MQYSLGIDAGGTYTDAILVRDADRSVVTSNKALTTYPDLIEGIQNAINGIDEEYLRKVKLVSLSTTLATNTVLEDTGYPVGLILAGDHNIEKDFPTNDIIFVSGGHDHMGEEMAPLDIEAVKNFVLRVKDNVSAFAVSGHFSIRNPEHELRVKEMITKLTGKPVVCGHELSQDIGAYERSVTAYLNAQLLPVGKHFINAIISEMKRRQMDARLIMLKCDGSVVGIRDALERPIETIFSGPAASLIGASYLSDIDTCAVIDVGGTSTDVSMLCENVPDLSEAGAIVGGWQTKVKAIHMETSAMGGDSHIWTKDKNIHIGPRRVEPLCLAAVKYKGFLEKLKRIVVPSRRLFDENIQPTKFFVRTNHEIVELTENEEMVLSVIGIDPVSFDDMSNRLKKPPSSFVLSSLIKKRLIQAIGFTPTDVLHVLGEYNEWNSEASKLGADVIAKLNNTGKYELSASLKKRFARNMSLELMSYILPGVDRSGIEKIVDGKFKAKFDVEIPVILLGGPVIAYKDEVRSFINADVIVPDHAEVGNAAGALFGKGIKRIEIMIKPVSVNDPDRDFFVFSPDGRLKFDTYVQALTFANDHGRSMAYSYMSECGIRESNVNVTVTEKHVSPEGWRHPPMESKITFVGVGII
ncbi:hydantoinase [Methanococcoides methylutens]|uniref:Hydantoinase n=1 Tax=Methanococcoides methylutens TaxID=2226 RepID=A0A099T685_METMT|nr:hydantoinase/oxoprolinase family protein [Methanococcoides methylutens]KGK99628.1 hydantoinase [Methanococcoides methylutens]